MSSIFTALAAQMPEALRTRSQTPEPGTTVKVCRVPSGSAAEATAVMALLSSISVALPPQVPADPRVRSQTVP
ncbi:hypothetical protein [Streptomyces sp. NK08204]|uniref:hypothetical protein n=1 Tax=Streptomyces sp. NK08204 TaxID=2873260 RepID=UPI001CEDFAC7|nr:hypothetical protein [Streptomyces sp. NK08204]